MDTQRIPLVGLCRNGDSGYDDTITRAIEQGYTLCSYANPIEGAREGLSADDACEIAKDDPSLVYAVRQYERECVHCGRDDGGHDVAAH